jgi:hypothetical protein
MHIRLLLETPATTKRLAVFDALLFAVIAQHFYLI